MNSNKPAGVRLPKVNDILLSLWGYDQVNSTFYKVIKVTGARVTLTELHNIETPSKETYMFGTTVPNMNGPKGATFVKGFKPSEYYGYSVKVNSYASAFPWDGKPAQVSHTH